MTMPTEGRTSRRHEVFSPYAIREADVQRLRDYGLTDAEIFDVAAAATARCFFSKLLDAMGAAPDAAYLDLEESVRKALTVGRLIDTMPTERVP